MVLLKISVAPHATVKERPSVVYLILKNIERIAETKRTLPKTIGKKIIKFGHPTKRAVRVPNFTSPDSKNLSFLLFKTFKNAPKMSAIKMDAKTLNQNLVKE